MIATAMGPYMSSRRRARRDVLEARAVGRCVGCGATGKLEFDHRDPSTKLFELSGANLDRPWAVIMTEFVKCQLLCRPCHVRKTALDGNSPGGRNRNTDPIVHGSMRCYQENGCRQPRCRRAKSLYRSKAVLYTTVIPL